MYVHAYIPPAAVATGRRRTTTGRTAERFICLTTITSQPADPSDLLLRMPSNSKNYGQQVTSDVLLVAMPALDARRNDESYHV
jgi:hypothetical protein